MEDISIDYAYVNEEVEKSMPPLFGASAAGVRLSPCIH